MRKINNSKRKVDGVYKYFLIVALIAFGSISCGNDDPPPADPPDPVVTEPEPEPVEVNPADTYTESIEIGNGTRPAIVIDSENSIIHLAYTDEHSLWYRQGDLNGNFGTAERILASRFENSAMWQPTIVLDENNVPHVAVHDSYNQWRGLFIYYTNRIGGTWSNTLTVFDIVDEGLLMGFNSFMAIENNTVYMTSFLIGGADPDFLPKNAYVLINDVDTGPNVASKEFSSNFATIFPYLKNNGELWVFQGVGSWASRWSLQQLDKGTMSPIGSPITFLNGKSGEQVRWLYDNSGEIHAAGSTYADNNPKKEGWYQTLSRATSGLDPIFYKTTNFHANGGAQPVRDLIAADRVYVTYWRGRFDTDRFGIQGENPWGCTVANQINFMRVENGEKAVEGKKITSRESAIHGTSYRVGPAAAAHPDGGMVVVFPECGTTNVAGTLYRGAMKLYFTHIGKIDN